MDIIRVDQSGMSMWRGRCQLMYYWAYVLGIEKKGKANPDSVFNQGSIAHEALAVIYHPDTWMDLNAAKKVLKDKWLDLKAKDVAADDPDRFLSWSNLLLETNNSFESYFNTYADYDSQYFEPVGPEVPFRFRLHEQVEYYGKIDAIVRWKKDAPPVPCDTSPNPRKGDGRLWFPEFKFYKTPEEHPAYIEWDPQLSSYSMVGRGLFGKDGFGGMLNRVNRKVDSAKLPNHFCHVVERSTDQLLFTAKDIVVQALQMKYILEHPMGVHFLVPLKDGFPYSWSNTCVNCEFNRPLCQAFRTGGDFESLYAIDYVQRAQYAFSEQDAQKIPVQELKLEE